MVTYILLTLNEGPQVMTQTGFGEDFSFHLFFFPSFLFCFSHRVPSWKLRAETFSAVTVCLRTCQPSTEWSLCCFYSHEGCCAMISASLHLPDNSVSKICAPAYQEPLFSLPKNKPDRMWDLGGHQSSSKTYLNWFFPLWLCCRLSQEKKIQTNLRLWVFWSFLLFLSSTFSFVTAGD